MIDDLFDLIRRLAAMSDGDNVKAVAFRLLGKNQRKLAIARDETEFFHIQCLFKVPRSEFNVQLGSELNSEL